MAEIIFGKLGNFTEQEYKNIKMMMNGNTYYDFKVSWSNYAGNCNLIVNAACPIEEAEGAKEMFLHSAISKGSDAYKMLNFLARYGNAHIKMNDEDNPLVCLKKWGFYYFFFGDAQTAKTLCDKYNEFVDTYGCACLSVKKEEFDEVLAIEAKRQNYRLIILEE